MIYLRLNILTTDGLVALEFFCRDRDADLIFYDK